MGQKVHPIGFRLGIASDWTSKWFAEGDDYAKFLNNDLEVRAFLKDKLSQASVSRIQIERPARAAFVTIHTARPGIVIGKNGSKLKQIGTRSREQIEQLLGCKVFLKLFVRVQKNWRKDTRALRKFGY